MAGLLMATPGMQPRTPEGLDALGGLLIIPVAIVARLAGHIMPSRVGDAVEFARKGRQARLARHAMVHWATPREAWPRHLALIAPTVAPLTILSAARQKRSVPAALGPAHGSRLVVITATALRSGAPLAHPSP